MMKQISTVVLVVGLVVSPAFVHAQASRIISSGTLPTACSVGNIYVKTGAAIGFYACLVTNTWSGPFGAAIVDADVPDTITIAGTNNVTWASVNKTGSSLADLATRVISNLQASTSAELAGVLSDETGTAGFSVLSVAPTLTGPVTLTGSGATSATKALVVEDSAGLDYFAARNDGLIGIGASVSVGQAAYSALQSGADFSGEVTATNTVNGNTTPVNFMFVDFRIAGTQEFTRALAAEFTARSYNTHTANAVGGGRFTSTIGTAAARAASLIGGEFLAKTGDATGGTVTTVAAGKFSTGINHASAIGTAAYGVWVDALVNSGTITNTYGIYVGDMTTGTQTNQAYNLYLSDTSARNLLGGNTDVTGTFTASSTIKGGGYQSSDGTAGATVTTCTGFKNGLCIAGT